MIIKNKNKLSFNKVISPILLTVVLLISIFYSDVIPTFAETESDTTNASSTEITLLDINVSTSTTEPTSADISSDIDTNQIVTTATDTTNTSTTTTTIATTTDETLPNTTEITSEATSAITAIDLNESTSTATSTEKNIATTTDQTSSTLKSIAIRTLPNKRIFVAGEELNIVGLVVKGTFSDGSVKILPISPAPDMANVIGFDSSVPVSNQAITIKYEGVSTSYTINIL